MEYSKKALVIKKKVVYWPRKYVWFESTAFCKFFNIYFVWSSQPISWILNFPKVKHISVSSLIKYYYLLIVQ